MRLLCKGIDLSDAVLKAVKACSNKTTKPILEGIKISAKNDNLSILATDEEISINTHIKADILEEGEVAVPGRYFSEFISKLTNEEILLFSEEDKLNIKYADSETFIQLLNVDEFPQIDNEINENSFSISKSDFKDIISKTTFACTQDDARPILKGCLLEVKDSILSCTALDGYRLAYASKRIISSTNDFSIVCPARTLNEIARMIEDNDEELKILSKKGMLLVSVDNSVITSRLYEGDFIKKDNIIPQSFSTEFVVNKLLLTDSVDRASVLAKGDKNSLILFDIKEGLLEINANSQIGKVNESVKIELSGKDMMIAMNSKYISDCLKNIDDEKIKFSCVGPTNPCILSPVDNDDYLYLILPVRTSA